MSSTAIFNKITALGLSNEHSFSVMGIVFEAVDEATSKLTASYNKQFLDLVELTDNKLLQAVAETEEKIFARQKQELEEEETRKRLKREQLAARKAAKAQNVQATKVQATGSQRGGVDVKAAKGKNDDRGGYSDFGSDDTELEDIPLVDRPFKDQIEALFKCVSESEVEAIECYKKDAEKLKKEGIHEALFVTKFVFNEAKNFLYAHDLPRHEFKHVINDLAARLNEEEKVKEQQKSDALGDVEVSEEGRDTGHKGVDQNGTGVQKEVTLDKPAWRVSPEEADEFLQKEGLPLADEMLLRKYFDNPADLKNFCKLPEEEKELCLSHMRVRDEVDVEDRLKRLQTEIPTIQRDATRFAKENIENEVARAEYISKALVSFVDKFAKYDFDPQIKRFRYGVIDKSERLEAMALKKWLATPEGKAAEKEMTEKYLAQPE